MKMKRSQLKEVIRAIVKQALKESFQTGEWWIDDDGSAQYADGDVGDVNHEAYIRQILVHDVLSDFGIDSHEGGGFLGDYEDQIKQELIDNGSLSQEELERWDDDPSSIILSKYDQISDVKDENQRHWKFFLAYGSNTTHRGDARDYGMKYMGYKRVVTRGNKAWVQTHTLTPRDLVAIYHGLQDMADEFEDDDAKLMVDIEVRATNKSYHDIPLEALGAKSAAAFRDYMKVVPWAGGDSSSIQEGYFRENKAWQVYEGSGHVVAMFEDNSRQSFEICFHNMMGEDKERWRQRAASKWTSIARKLHGDVQLSEVGNPIQKSWQQCFKEALEAPEMKEFIRNPKHKKIFDDRGYPKKMAKKAATVMDPVNFTKTG
jgi:hypothetical protein